jgi:lipoate-protein ligase A
MTQGEFIVYNDKTHDPVFNFEREADLFEAVENRSSPDCLRFWVNSPCLVRGRARSARYGWYNEGLARELKIPVIERATGGGVVYHDEGNLNWSFFFRTSGAFQSPTASFGRASRFVIAALGHLGLRARFSPPNRIDVAGRKISGMAARSTVRTLLVHGTLLLNSDLKTLNRLCIPPAGCPPVSNLTEWKPGIDAESVANAVIGVLGQEGYRVRMGDATS